MLTDVEWIFVILALIYLAECGCWLRGDAVCFSAGMRRCRPLRAVAPLQNDSGRLVFTDLPPWSQSWVCQAWSWTVDGETLALAGAMPGGRDGVPALLPIRFDSIHSVQVQGRNVMINDRLAASFTTEELASFAVDWLEAIRSAAPPRRERAVFGLLDQITDADAAGDRLAIARKILSPLRTAACTLFFLTFAAGPLIYYGHGVLGWPAGAWVALSLAALWLVCLLATLVLYGSARKRLYQEPLSRRAAHIAMLACSPASAMRAAESLGRHALTTFHPLAAASVVCDEVVFRHVAERWLRDMHFGPDGAASPSATPFARHLAMRAEQLVKQKGLDPVELLAAPTPSDDARAFCPRCTAQYVLSHGHCADCGAELRPFDRQS